MKNTRADLEQALSVEKYARKCADKENARLGELLDDGLERTRKRVAELEQLLSETKKTLEKRTQESMLLIIKSYEKSLELDQALLHMAVHGSADAIFRDALDVAATNNRQIRESLELISKLQIPGRSASVEHITNALIGKE